MIKTTIMALSITLNCYQVLASQGATRPKTLDQFETLEALPNRTDRDLISSMHDLDLGDCSDDKFKVTKRGPYFAVYTNDDSCDGGNSFGVIYKGSKAIGSITDSDIEYFNKGK